MKIKKIGKYTCLYVEKSRFICLCYYKIIIYSSVSYGSPLAAGGLARPINPARAKIVRM